MCGSFPRNLSCYVIGIEEACRCSSSATSASFLFHWHSLYHELGSIQDRFSSTFPVQIARSAVKSPRGAARYERSRPATPQRLLDFHISQFDTFWRALTRGEWRELQSSITYGSLHSDATDVGYGGTLDTNMEAGSPCSPVAQFFRSADDCINFITLRKLRSIRLLLKTSQTAISFFCC